MAWQAHGRDNDSLVDALVAHRLVTSKNVEEALRAVDRGRYCPTTLSDEAYADRPLPLGHGQTISAPHSASCLLCHS